MKIVKSLKRIPFLVNTVRFLRRLSYKSRRAKTVTEYIQNNHVRKLHIGAGQHNIGGWLNTDLFPLNNDILFLDATESFPFENELFDYIFSEHQIEHIYYHEAVEMLKECYRALKTGGKIRISTPDLKFFATPFDGQKLEYVRFITDVYIKKGFYKSINYLPNNNHYRESFVINDIFYNYDHKFIYDLETISDILDDCGFSDIMVCQPGCSLDENLQNIDRVNGSLEALSTIIIEAKKL